MRQITDVKEAWKALAEGKVLRHPGGTSIKIDGARLVTFVRAHSEWFSDAFGIGCGPWTVGRWCSVCQKFEADGEKCPKERAEQMMVCPKAGLCDKRCAKFEFHHSVPHSANAKCDRATDYCPACVPVQTEPQTEEWALRNYGDGSGMWVCPPGVNSVRPHDLIEQHILRFLCWFYSPELEQIHGARIRAYWHFWVDERGHIYHYGKPGWTHHIARAALMLKENHQ